MQFFLIAILMIVEAPFFCNAADLCVRNTATMSNRNDWTELSAGNCKSCDSSRTCAPKNCNCPTGPKGRDGRKGAKGPAGATGLTGDTGARGEAGPTGAPGAPGSAVSTGATGETGATGPMGAAGLPGSAASTGATGEAGPTGATGSTGAAGSAGSEGATGPTGSQGTVGGVLAFADFYALMPGDNSSTVGAGVAVEFAQDGPTTASGITRFGGSSPSEFVLAAIGTYQILFQVSVTEAGQLVVAIDSSGLGTGFAEQAYTVVGRATGTSQIVGMCLVTTTAANSLLAIRNPTGNATALTITPLAGGTHPVSAHLLITRFE